jgi:DNA mismatch repair protein MutS
MDEIGRGTSTYDGISLAWAVAEYLVSSFKSPPKTLFATHYHELQTLESQYPHLIRNFHMAVADDRGTPIFLHTILPGGASHSFGVAVAKLAGIPEIVIQNAEKILRNLEKRSVEDSSEMSLKSQSYHIQESQLANHLIHKELENIDISQLTPLQALNKLAEIKDKMKLLDTDEKLLRND